MDDIEKTIRVPEKYLWKAFKDRLKGNDCYNRGFVLDGYPRCYKDCQKIFTKRVRKIDDEEDDLPDSD